jgi:hypothetical protein
MLPYETASECLETLLGVKISDSTVYRLTDKKGQQALEQIEKDKEWKKEELTNKSEDDRIYSQIDGNMILIRGEGWKEVKLSRTFRAEDIENKGNGQKIAKSTYAAKLGGKDAFSRTNR